jgi:hypothetical protein
MEAVVWGIAATDPATFTGIALILISAAGIAIYQVAQAAA